MKVVLLPGHAKSREGAAVCAGSHVGVGEFELARQYLPQLGAYLEAAGYEVAQTNRESAGGASPVYSAKAANATRADVALEWHFNSAGPEVSGCEVLYWGPSSKGRWVAARISRAISRILGLKDRGAKPVWGPDDRGYHAFKRSEMPFFMIEPCFAGSNEKDARVFCEAIDSGRWPAEMATALVEILKKAYGKEN